MELQISNALLALALATPSSDGENVPFLFWGAPGKGKTRQVEATLDVMGWARMTLSPDHDETTYGLVPAVNHETRRTTNYPHDWVDALASRPRSAVIIDDLTAASGIVHAAQLRLLTHRTTAGIKLPPRCAVIGLTNKPDDAANGQRLHLATASRFVHVQVHRTPAESAAQILRGFKSDAQGVDTLIQKIERGFSHYLEQEVVRVAGYVLACNVMDTVDRVDDLDIVVTANDRTVEFMTRVVAAARCIDAEHLIPALVSGSIGRGHGAAYIEYCRRQNVPSDEAVLAGWRPKPQETDIVFLVLNRLVSRAAVEGQERDRFVKVFWDLCLSLEEIGVPTDLVIPSVRQLYQSGIYPPSTAAVNRLLEGVVL